MVDKSPEQLAQEEVKRSLVTLGRWVIDHSRRYFSLSLLKLVVAGIASIALGVISLPVLAAAGCAVVIVLAIAYSISAHKLFHDERETRQWAFVRGKRVQQEKLDAEQRVDQAVLAIMGKPEDRELRATPRTPELAQALRVVRHRLAENHAAQFPQPGSAQQHKSAMPQEPDLKVVRARITERTTEREALEAEIQSLASSEDIAAAMAAEDACKHAKSASDSARQASQAARERKRNGQSATQPEAGISLGLTLHPNGARNVRRVQPKLTPEQIAQGLTEPPKADNYE